MTVCSLPKADSPRAAVFVMAVTLIIADAGALELSGRAIQGGLMQGHTEPGATVRLDGRSLRVSPDGVFILGFGRDAPPSATLEITRRDGSREQREIHVARRDYDIQHITGLPARKVNPDPADLERIRRDAARVREARTRDAARSDFLSGFRWPVQGPVTGVYGSQRVLNGEPRRPHFGIDIAAPEGTPVVAPAAGVVTFYDPDLFFSGGTLILDHGHGLSSAFLHLRSARVREGERVRQGEVIAEVGATGRVTGAHLDWRVNLFQRRLDPALLLEQWGPDR